ncbi:hypothetical protein Y032_0105g3705 [Ancylostoma ceylanicum]|uniref:Uncharacterized protein n=1 Tax=Ancylostoma ceylanicum TaxID=53326 RepID=A0A016TGJ1_9BILA|nr:hypothetical protein Y032_0105g3705 [Ancylostoma ceylanicum]
MERNALYAELRGQLKNDYGITMNNKQIKNNFNWQRSKVFNKFGRAEKRNRREMKYRLKTGGEVCLRLEERFAASPPASSADALEEARWGCRSTPPRGRRIFNF